MTATMKNPDQVLLYIRRAQRGDQRAFEELVCRFRARLEGFTRSRIRPHLLRQLRVEDLVHDTFARAFESLDRFQGNDEDSFFRWLAGIAKRVVLKSLERIRRDEGLKIVRARPSGSTSPSRAMRREERFERLQGALDHLKDEYRDVVCLCRVEGLPIKEVARRMERSPDAVKKLLWRALRQLRTFLNCTIVGNRATGVRCSGGNVTLTNCTISGNGLTGVYSSVDHSPIMTNCIVWENGGEAIRTEHSVPQVIFSCIEGGWPGEGNLDSDPLFARKGVFDFTRDVNGTPDFIIDPGDYQLQPGSPCIDSGTPEGATAFDIRGRRRPCGAGVDMGAYESGECPPATQFTRGDANADGKLDIADTVFVLSYLFAAGAAVPSCKKAADANDSGAVDLADAVYLLSFLFSGGGPPAAPFAECGPDPTPDDVSCESFPSC